MQLKGWNDVQPDVLQKIMGYLTAEEVWNARRASRVWASAARKVACFSVSIPASLETVQNKSGGSNLPCSQRVSVPA